MKKSIKLISIILIQTFLLGNIVFAGEERDALQEDKLSPHLAINSEAFQTISGLFLSEISKQYTFQKVFSPKADDAILTLESVFVLTNLLKKGYNAQDVSACGAIINEMIKRGVIVDEKDNRLVPVLELLHRKLHMMHYPQTILNLRKQSIIEAWQAESFVDDFFKGYFFVDNSKKRVVDFYISMFKNGVITREKVLEKADKIFAAMTTGYDVAEYLDSMLALYECKLLDKKLALAHILSRIDDIRDFEKTTLIKYMEYLFKIFDIGLIQEPEVIEHLSSYVANKWEEVHYSGNDPEKLDLAFIQEIGFDGSEKQKMLLALKDLEKDVLIDKARAILKENAAEEDDIVITPPVSKFFAQYDQGEIDRRELTRVLAEEQNTKEKLSEEATSEIIFNEFDRKFIDRDAAIKELRKVLSLTEKDYAVYMNICLGMFDRELIEKEEAARLFLKTLSQAEKFRDAFSSDFAGYYQKLLKRNLLYRKEHFLILKKVMDNLETRGHYTYYVKLFSYLVDTGNLTIDKNFINKQAQQAKEKNYPIGYYMNLEKLQRQEVISQAERLGIQEKAEDLFFKIDETNEDADREDKKVELNALYGFYAQGLASLQAVSPVLAKEIVCNHCQRGYLPLLTQDLGNSAELTAYFVKELKEFYEKRVKAKRKPTPALMMQLISFANVYKNLGLEQKEFSRIMHVSAKDEDVIFPLGRNIIEELAKKFKININLSQDDDVFNTLTRWNLKYLGAIVRASEQWESEDVLMFKLVIKTALEGKFHAVLFPEEYSEVLFSEYSEEEKELIGRIRKYNARFLRIARQLGVNVGLFTRPERFPAKMTIETQSILRNWQVVLSDFRQNYNNFMSWIESSEYAQDTALKNRLKKVKNGLGGFRNVVEDKAVEVGVFNGAQVLKKSLQKFLLDFKRINFPEENPSEELVDLIRSIEEIIKYDYEVYKTQKIPLRMRFWKREVGRDSVIANEVNSCTSLDSDSRAIFEYLLDLGTVYLIIEDPATGKEQGYVRFFLTITKEGKPGIFIDSADGVANKEMGHPIDEAFEYIKEFARDCNIDPGNVEVSDVKSIEKAGGALTEKYNTHSSFEIEGFDEYTHEDEGELDVFEQTYNNVVEQAI